MTRAVLAVAALSLALALGGCNWMKGLGKKDNVEPPTALTEFVPSISVQRSWSSSIGNGAGSSGARMTPAVVGDRLYAASVDGQLSALDATTGRTLWSKRDKKQAWSGGPAVHGDLLVVGTLDGAVYAFSAADGSERWHVKVSSEVIAAPAITDSVIAVRLQDGRLLGLNPSDGARMWIYEQAVPILSLRGNSSPIAGGGFIFGGYDSGRVTAVRDADGAPAWVQTLSTGEGRTEVERLSDVDGQLVLDGNELFAVGYRGQLAALSADSGRSLWTRDFSSYAGVAVSANAVVSSDAEGNVWAFDRSTGANLWKQDALLHRWLSAPAIQGDYAVVGDLDGYVHWLSLSDGKLAARERLGKKAIEGAPLVVGDTLFVEDVGGRIAAWRTR